MRLLNTKTRELESFFGKPAPDYAILSHTWHDGEVIFEEFNSAGARQQLGYLKIQQACLQAEKDGLGWIWIDTCGIDKRSSAELSEAINSMFRWYQNAVVCYAFLNDIQTVEQFAQARWFTRGWTLQELIAPKEVRFFNSEWEFIGERSELAVPIKRVTGINQKALRSLPEMKSLRLDYIRTTSIAKRMSWAAGRNTTRQEDIAYCLMGLFNVSMPLLYGEGLNAFRRLQEEIMRASTDQTVFAHYAPSQSRPPVLEHQSSHEQIPLLARHPACFESSRKLHRIENQEQSFQLTNRELSISMPVYQVSGTRNDYIAIPACHEDRDLSVRIGIRLRSVTPIYNTWLRIFSAFLRLPVVRSQSGVPTFVRLTGHAAIGRKGLNRAQMMKINVLRDPVITAGRTRLFQISEIGTTLVGTRYRRTKQSKLLVTSNHHVFEILGNSGPRTYYGIFHVSDWGCFTVQVEFDSSQYTATAEIIKVHPKSVTIEDCDGNDAFWKPPPGTRLIFQGDDSLCFQAQCPRFFGFGHHGRAFSVSVAWQIKFGREVLVLHARYGLPTTFNDFLGDTARNLVFLKLHYLHSGPDFKAALVNFNAALVIVITYVFGVTLFAVWWRGFSRISNSRRVLSLLSMSVCVWVLIDLFTENPPHFYLKRLLGCFVLHMMLLFRSYFSTSLDVPSDEDSIASAVILSACSILLLLFGGAQFTEKYN